MAGCVGVYPGVLLPSHTQADRRNWNVLNILPNSDMSMTWLEQEDPLPFLPGTCSSVITFFVNVGTLWRVPLHLEEGINKR